MTEFVTNLLGILTILLDVFVVVTLLLWVTSYFSQWSKNVLSKIIKSLDKKEILFGFIIALVSTVGSLYFSEIAGYTPCELCWYQRIFMYPQVLVLGMAYYKKDKKIADYSLAMSVIGFLIAVYHYIIQFADKDIAPCKVVGYSSSCSDHFTLNFGYITIPMMALTAFAGIIILMLFLKANSNKGLLKRILEKIT